MKKNGQLMVLEDNELQSLLDHLKTRHYRLIGPTVHHFAMVYDEIEKADDFPKGYHDQQDGGRYRLIGDGKPARFNCVVGQHSWKKYLFPPEKILFEAHRKPGGFDISKKNELPEPLAFIGVRPCDLAAIAILDKIMMEGPYQDTFYRQNRENLMIIAFNCTRPSGTCFCTSMNTGPKAVSGFDLALTEIVEDNSHYYLVECGSKKGSELAEKLPLKKASQRQVNKGYTLLQNAAEKMGRKLNTDQLKDVLLRNFENSRWDMVAERCLCCGNCTLVCPTCFCTNVSDFTDLNGQTAYRRQQWDSCFTLEHSYISGGSIRTSAKAQYRQWMTHKLANWIDQFGMSGCVGCGRCITWCPVGIDITEEADAIRKSDESPPLKKGDLGGF